MRFLFLIIVSIATAKALIQNDVGSCAKNPPGTGPVTTPDTSAAFVSNQIYANAAKSAKTPAGFTSLFTDLNAIVTIEQILTQTISTYDPQICADFCKSTYGCSSFNIYYARDPTVVPGNWCQNPASLSNINCTYSTTRMVTSDASFTSETLWEFQIVFAGSNAYNLNIGSNDRALSSSSTRTSSTIKLSSPVPKSSSFASASPLRTSSSIIAKVPSPSRSSSSVKASSSKTSITASAGPGASSSTRQATSSSMVASGKTSLASSSMPKSSSFASSSSSRTSSSIIAKVSSPSTSSSLIKASSSKPSITVSAGTSASSSSRQASFSSMVVSGKTSSASSSAPKPFSTMISSSSSPAFSSPASTSSVALSAVISSSSVVVRSSIAVTSSSVAATASSAASSSTAPSASPSADPSIIMPCPTTNNSAYEDSSSASGATYNIYCNQSMNMDSGAREFYKTGADNFEECIAICSSTANCGGATYGSGTCWVANGTYPVELSGPDDNYYAAIPLPSASSPANPTNVPCPTADGSVYEDTASGASYKIHCNQAANWNSDYTDFEYLYTIASFEQCIAICSSTPDCRAANYAYGYLCQIVNGTDPIALDGPEPGYMVAILESVSLSADPYISPCPTTDVTVYEDSTSASDASYDIHCNAFVNPNSDNSEFYLTGADNFKQCISICSNTTNCGGATYSTGTCWIANGTDPINFGSGDNGYDTAILRLS